MVPLNFESDPDLHLHAKKQYERSRFSNLLIIEPFALEKGEKILQ